jgi:hypothetical protein
MKWFTWFLRRPDPEPAAACRRCTTPLTLCRHCEGDWRSHACDQCALGYNCPTHASSWT